MSKPEERWMRAKIGDLIRLEYGRSLVGATRSGEGYPVFGSSGLVGHNSMALVDGPGIIVGRKGTVGALAWSPMHFWPIDTTYYVCWRNEKLVDRRWTYWLLSTLPLKRLDSSTGVPGLNRNDAYRISIPLPPIKEQRRIARILDTAEEAIRSTELFIAKLEQAKQGLLHNFLTRGTDSWAVTSVGSVGEVLLGRQRSPQHQKGRFLVPYLRVANVFDGFIDYSDILRMNFTPREQEIYGLKNGDLLLNEGQSLELVGRCAIYEGRPDLHCFQNTLVRYRCSESLIPKFAYLTFKRWLILGRFMQVAKKTTSMAHLGASRFAAMSMAVPSLEEQRTIVAIFDSCECRIELERYQLAKQKLMKQGLMDDLLTGRVRAGVSG